MVFIAPPLVWETSWYQQKQCPLQARSLQELHHVDASCKPFGREVLTEILALGHKMTRADTPTFKSIKLKGDWKERWKLKADSVDPAH